MKAAKLTPAALRMIDGLPNGDLVYILTFMRATARGLGIAVPSRKRLYTPAQFRVYERLKAQIRWEKAASARDRQMPRGTIKPHRV